jgi:hypothetical protein
MLLSPGVAVHPASIIAVLEFRVGENKARAEETLQRHMIPNIRTSIKKRS